MNEELYRDAEQRLWKSLGVIVDERRVVLARYSISVRVQEVGDGQPVLFLHGANTSGSSWASLASRLDGFRCLILDRPGTGLSAPLPKSPGVAGQIAFGESVVADVLDALEIESAHVVATSYGGFLALRSAAAYPDRIRRMVQFSWPVGAPVGRLPLSMRIMAIPGVAQLAAAVPASERSVRMTFRSVGHGPSLEAGRITRQDIETYLALLRHTQTLRNELALARSTISPLRGLDSRLLPQSVLRAIDIPTRFVWGERDPFGGPDVARRVAGMIPGAELEIVAGAGHAPWLDALERCAASTAEFLARQAPHPEPPPQPAT